MYTLYDPQQQKVPIKVWLDDPGLLDAQSLEQALHLSRLPFAFQWIALMPDMHSGYGMPIGGVLATKDRLVPNAVGVDIGCGLLYVQTDIPIELLRSIQTPNGVLIQAIAGDVLRNLPTGFEHHQSRKPCECVSRFRVSEARFRDDRNLLTLLDEVEYQVGTLGGGNHFVEFQEDPEGHLGIMIHSGSRNLGYKICAHFNSLAKTLDTQTPHAWDLASLPAECLEGNAYLRWMDLAMDFALENRRAMADWTVECVRHRLKEHTSFSPTFDSPIDCHHNFAIQETHYGQEVFVHRKGAIRARKGDPCIIPGAMGSYSYLAVGSGNPESFDSCSHGAGRKMSRSEAQRTYSVQETLEDLKLRGVYIAKQKKGDIAEETRFAYKDIDTVLKAERDLVQARVRLKTVAVIKG